MFSFLKNINYFFLNYHNEIFVKITILLLISFVVSQFVVVFLVDDKLKKYLYISVLQELFYISISVLAIVFFIFYFSV